MNRIEQLTRILTNQFSVVETEGEREISNLIYEILQENPYFKQHPEQLYFVDAKDEFNRKSVVAIVKGKIPSKKTVVYLGHTDTVGISDYQELKQYANQPDILKAKLKEKTWNEKITADLNNDNYLFGRGIFDMKSGVAVIMALLEKFANEVDQLEGNIIFAAVCDEEANSHGMLSFVEHLATIANEYDIQSIICSDYMSEAYPNDPNRYIYVGTIGKLMPSFYVVGKETHVGESFNGIDPNAISSAILNEIQMNVDYCDIVDNEITLPPISLLQKDGKTEYSVQTAKTAVLFFNYATYYSTPEIVLNKMKQAAKKAFDQVILNLKQQYQKYNQIRKQSHLSLPWKTQVVTYEELLKHIQQTIPDIHEKLNTYANQLMSEKLDPRTFAQKMVQKLHMFYDNDDPIVIVYLSPPYYPHNYVNGKNKKEKALLDAVQHAIHKTKYDKPIVSRKFFPYISDISYASAPENHIMDNLKQNMPGFGIRYDLPINAMQKLSLPVVDIGCFGYDAHQVSERVQKSYSFEITPKLIYETTKHLLKK